MPAFSVINAHTRAGAVYITLFYLLTFSTFVLLTRISYRWRHYHYDDIFFAASYVLQLVYISVILLGLSNGLASLQDPEGSGVKIVSDTILVTQTLLLAILGFLKLSSAYLLRRLCPPSLTQMVFRINILMALVGLGTIASILTIRIGCSSPQYAIHPSESCSHQAARWGFVAGFDLFTELLFFATAIALVVPLQMSWKLKCDCLILLGMRLFVGALGIVHTSRLLQWSHKKETQLSIDSVLIYQTVQIALSTLLATVPILKSFVKSFDTGFGLQAGLSTSLGSYGTGSRRLDDGIELSSMHGTVSTKSRMGGRKEPYLNPHQQQYTVDIHKTMDSSRRNSADSEHSQAIMVQRVVHVEG